MKEPHSSAKTAVTRMLSGRELWSKPLSLVKRHPVAQRGYILCTLHATPVGVRYQRFAYPHTATHCQSYGEEAQDRRTELMVSKALAHEVVGQAGTTKVALPPRMIMVASEVVVMVGLGTVGAPEAPSS